MALVDVPGGYLRWPYYYGQAYNLDGALQVDDDTDKIAIMCSVPVSGTLTQVAFYLETVATSGTVAVSIEPVDAGVPTGTPVTNGTGTVAVTSGDTGAPIACDINGGTGISVTAGTRLGFVFSRSASSGDWTMPIPWLKYGWPCTMDYNISSGAAWTLANGTSASILLNIGGWVTPHGAAATPAMGKAGLVNGDERGNLFQMPFDVRAAGICVGVDIGDQSAQDVVMKLYSTPLGTPSLMASATIEKEYTGSNDGLYWGIFDTPQELSADTRYAMVLLNSGANAIDGPFRSTRTSATYKASYPGGQYFTECTRSGGSGSFTEDDDFFNSVFLVIDQIDQPAGSGGWGFRRRPRTTGA